MIIREAMKNGIAHQDYTKGGRINVVEMDDQLVFTNLGSFIPDLSKESSGKMPPKSTTVTIFGDGHVQFEDG